MRSESTNIGQSNKCPVIVYFDANIGDNDWNIPQVPSTKEL